MIERCNFKQTFWIVSDLIKSKTCRSKQHECSPYSPVYFKPIPWRLKLRVCFLSVFFKIFLYMFIRGSIKIKTVENLLKGVQLLLNKIIHLMDNVIIFHFNWKMTSSFAKENSQCSTNYVIEARYVKEKHGPAFSNWTCHFTSLKIHCDL